MISLLTRTYNYYVNYYKKLSSMGCFDRRGHDPVRGSEAENNQVYHSLTDLNITNESGLCRQLRSYSPLIRNGACLHLRKDGRRETTLSGSSHPCWEPRMSFRGPPSPSSMNTGHPQRFHFSFVIFSGSGRRKRRLTSAMKTTSIPAHIVSWNGRNWSKSCCPRML